MKKNIGINLLYINPKLAGGSVTYALKFLEELKNIDKETNYIVYINKDCEKVNFKIGHNFRFRILNFRYTNVFKRYFWEQFILPFYIYKDKLDLIHSLGYVTPLLSSVKKIVSILDINYKGHSNNMSVYKRKLLGLMVYLSAKSSKKIITISEFSKEQIIKHTNTHKDKVTVTLLSGSTDNIIDVKNIPKSQYNFDSPYIISFSSPSPHKNIARLIKAFKEIAKVKPNLKLVLVGHSNKSEALQELILENNLREKIIFTGFVADKEIIPLISASELFVFPSLYEGFGIPLLDAQQCNVAVLSSNAGSLPEVGGKGAIYFNPLSIDEMEKEILKVLKNEDLKNEVKQFGLINRQNFSWNKTANQTYNLYEEILMT